MLNVGSYDLADAARYAGLRPSRARRWLQGYSHKTGSGEVRVEPPVIRRGEDRTEASVTFLDLIEMRFVKAFLDRGVSLQAIRRATVSAQAIVNQPHPFCVKQFATDGRTILARVAKDDGEQAMLDLLKNQWVFTEVFEPILKNLDYAGIDVERWWPLGRQKLVVIDPARSFGEPVVLLGGVPTRMIAGAHKAGERVGTIARWYGISVGEVRAAIAFEATAA